MATQLQAREYLVLGDSNVSRFYTRIGLTMSQNLDFVQARNIEEVNSGLAKINRSYKYVVMAFWSNLVVAAGDSATNDIDRMSSIDDLFNQVVPLIRLVFQYPDTRQSRMGPSWISFYLFHVLVYARAHHSRTGTRGIIFLRSRGHFSNNQVSQQQQQ